jgi:hypothetical protein
MMTFTQAGTTDRRSEGLTGEPDAPKSASPVRRGAVGKGLLEAEQHLAGGLPYKFGHPEKGTRQLPERASARLCSTSEHKLSAESVEHF